MTHRSIPALFFARVDQDADEIGLYWREDGGWKSMSWRDMELRLSSLTRLFDGLGVKKGTPVAILADTRREWAAADLATLCLGGITVGIYPSLLDDQVAYILEHAECEVAIVENAEQYAKVAKHRERLPKLRHVLSIDPVEGLARAKEDDFPPDVPWLRGKAAPVGPEDVATLIYTSGTTGEPKGAILTHGNFLHVVYATESLIDVTPEDRSLIFLPLAHSLQRMAGYRGLLQHGHGYYIRLNELIDAIPEVKPTVLATVPRMLEKIHAKALAAVTARGRVARRIYDWAFSVGKRRTMAIERGQRVPRRVAWQFAVADRLVFRKIRDRLGGKLRLMVSGGSALNTEVAYWFFSAGIPVLEGWGLTETAAPATCNRLDAFKIGTVGRPIDGIEVKVDPADGELLVRGPGVFQGYYKNAFATEEAFTDGWFRTGDIGVIDADGFVKITDRKKELIVTAGGKNIAPVPIEKKIERSPFVMQAVAIGDDKPYLVALLAPDVEELPALARSLDLPVDEPAQLLRHPRVLDVFKDAVQRANAELPRYEQVKRFEILPAAFSVETGELTPTMKLKRRVVAQKYADRIAGLYSGGGIDMGAGGE